MKQTASIKEIARQAGVSVATVSRVINQNGRFSKETEARVRQIIAQNNYEPNLLARSLRTSRARVVGIVMPDITNEFFSAITLEMQNNLLAMGYSAIICNTQGDSGVELKYHAMLRAQQISGLVYIAGEASEEIPMLDIQIVYIDRSPLNTMHTQEFVTIMSDNKNGGYLAAKELLDKGCSTVAMLMPQRGGMMYEERMEGYMQALEEAGIQFDRELLCYTDSAGISQGSQGVSRLFAEYPIVDGIFCACDTLAYGAVDWLRKNGRRVPGDVRVVGYDDISASALLGLTTVRQTAEDFGGISAEALIAMIEDKPLPATEYTLPVTLIRRESTR